MLDLSALDRAIAFFSYCKDKGNFDTQIAIDNLSKFKKELEELNKEDMYMFEKINESLKMGNKAQSIAILEVARILKNRIEAKGE